MKLKPDTELFKKNLIDFVDSWADDLAVAHSHSDSQIEKVYREQKVFRLSLDLISELKCEAYERSVEAGVRVTETEIVEQALRAFFKI